MNLKELYDSIGVEYKEYDDVYFEVVVPMNVVEPITARDYYQTVEDKILLELMRPRIKERTLLALQSERDYQESLKANPDHPDMVELQMGSYIAVMQHILNQAREVFYTDSQENEYQDTMEYIRKLGGMCVSAGDKWDMPFREVEEEIFEDDVELLDLKNLLKAVKAVEEDFEKNHTTTTKEVVGPNHGSSCAETVKIRYYNFHGYQYTSRDEAISSRIAYLVKRQVNGYNERKRL